MRLPKRDLIATALVGLAALVWLLWAFDAPGLGRARVAGAAVLALGIAASAIAVVPGFAKLLHGDKVYLVSTSVIGIAALVGGLMTLISASAGWLGLVIVATLLLWLITTVHHVRLAEAAPSPTCPNCRQAMHTPHCDVCGYDLFEQTRDEEFRLR